jgi:hypothetical protein
LDDEDGGRRMKVRDERGWMVVMVVKGEWMRGGGGGDRVTEEREERGERGKRDEGQGQRWRRR